MRPRRRLEEQHRTIEGVRAETLAVHPHRLSVAGALVSVAPDALAR
jgi:hypothetical protein